MDGAFISNPTMLRVQNLSKSVDVSVRLEESSHSAGLNWINISPAANFLKEGFLMYI